MKGSSQSALAEVRFYVPDTIFYLEAELLFTESSAPGLEAENTDNVWRGALGLASVDGLLFLTRYSDDQDYRFNIETQYVTELPGGSAVRLEASYYDFDQSDFISVGGDYYLDRSWSVGAWLVTSSDVGLRLDTSDNGFGIRTKKFFRDSFGISVELYEFDAVRLLDLTASMRL